MLIDLSGIDYNTTRNDIKNLLIKNIDNKKWIFNKKERKIYNSFKEKARPFESTKNGKGIFCPQYLYGWKGESSARRDDCIYCEYCFSIEGEANCLGYTGVSKIADLNNLKLSEVAVKLRKENYIKPEWLQGTQCKSCKQGYMVLKDGKNGKFLGCSNYPRCRHTIKI